MPKDIIKIQFKNGVEALFDYDALTLLAKYKWYPVKKRHQWYIYANGPGTTVQFHRLYMECPKGLEVDHINGNALDNRRANLRVCSRLINQNNLRTYRGKKTSKYRYVYWDTTRNQWFTQVTYNKKTKSIGRFECEVQAAVAANNYILQNRLPKLLNEV